MKKNNGSLQLWLWTATPFLFLFSIVVSPYLWSNQFAIAMCIFGAMTLISLPVHKRMLQGERDSMNDAALKFNGNFFNVFWAINAVGLCFYVLLGVISVISRL